MRSRQSAGSWVVLGALVMVALGTAAFADYKDDIRYTQLKAELGAATPDGLGVRVGQIEAAMNDWHYGVDASIPELQLPGRQFTYKGGSTLPTWHAADVARRFYGANSMTPQITTIELYSAFWHQVGPNQILGWVDSPYLRQTGLQMPVNPPVDQRMKVVNHSWMGEWTGGFGSDGKPNNNNVDILRRLDYVIHTQEQINVVGLPNAGQPKVPLLAGSYNAIAVGVTSGQHVTGAMDLKEVNYHGSRIRPDLVAPDTGTSYATPQVSSAAVLLVDAASRAGHAYGAKPQVIKAALMAGADKAASFGSAYTRSTANGLSSQYGAGELDIYNSYKIIAAGEPAGSGIGRYGFDYNPAFSSDDTVRYAFRTGETTVALQASLVWHLHVLPKTPFPDQAYFGTDVLYDLDLALYDITAGETLIQASVSTLENTENLWLIDLPAGRDYELRVTGKGSAFTWDYALAWQFSGDVIPVPEPASLAGMVISITLLLRRRRTEARTT